MTDTIAPSAGLAARRLDVASGEAQARLRARYRAEARFKLYGVIAIACTTLFLVVLVADIVAKGIPAFFEHVVTLPVELKAEPLTGDDGKITGQSIRAADYFPITRDALTAIVPGLSRSGERTLTRLLSTGAGDELRRRLVADRKLVGRTITLPLLLSDDADLYLEGAGTKVLTRPTRGIASISENDGELRVASSAGDFAETLVALKKMRGRTAQPGAGETLDNQTPSLLLAVNGGLVKVTRLTDTEAVGETLLPLQSRTGAAAGTWQIVTYATPEANRKVTDLEVALLERLKSLGLVRWQISWRFFTSGDSREPELAGIRGAVVGSALTLLVTLALCVPIGVMAAIYLEEFAPKNRITEIIEVNINNLAAVPSIVFGLLGLAVFLNFFGLPRSAPLVGGLVLALLVLPTIIIASRAALKSVPPSIKEAALGVGASHQQAVFHHVLPLAMPGIMTGTIIGMAHALGETAPLLMIGMVAFIVDVPGGVTDAATVLPVQIYLWSDLPEQAFKAKTAALIIVLLMFLFCMNGAAIWLRRRFERRW